MHISEHLPSEGAHSQDHGRLSVEHISKHSHKNLRRHTQDHGRLPGKHISKHSQKNLHTRWTPSSARVKKWGCEHIHPCWRLCLHRRSTAAFVWIHITLTFKHCAEVTLCQHFLKPSQKKSFVTVSVPGWWSGRGNTCAGQDTWDNGHVRQQRDDVKRWWRRLKKKKNE